MKNTLSDLNDYLFEQLERINDDDLDDDDERHICPLQLPVIERCIKLWSNEGDIVFTPFAGIGSEVYQSVKMNRRGIGIELKKTYYDQAVKNLKAIEFDKAQPTIFDFMNPPESEQT